VVDGSQTCGIIYEKDVVPAAINPLVYIATSFMRSCTLCLKDELDGVIATDIFVPVLMLVGIVNDDALGIVSSVTVADAVKSDIDTPPYLPLNSMFAFIVIDLVPSLLCGTVTVYSVAYVVCIDDTLGILKVFVQFFLSPLMMIYESDNAVAFKL
jgi:hypothetical protein